MNSFVILLTEPKPLEIEDYLAICSLVLPFVTNMTQYKQEEMRVGKVVWERARVAVSRLECDSKQLEGDLLLLETENGWYIVTEAQELRNNCIASTAKPADTLSAWIVLRHHIVSVAI